VGDERKPLLMEVSLYINEDGMYREESTRITEEFTMV
jgi:hypothetical protein